MKKMILMLMAMVVFGNVLGGGFKHGKEIESIGMHNNMYCFNLKDDPTIYYYMDENSKSHIANVMLAYSNGYKISMYYGNSSITINVPDENAVHGSTSRNAINCPTVFLKKM